MWRFKFPRRSRPSVPFVRKMRRKFHVEFVNLLSQSKILFTFSFIRRCCRPVTWFWRFIVLNLWVGVAGGDVGNLFVVRSRRRASQL